METIEAPAEILNVWRQFDSFPMETLTKAWYFQRSGEKKQRSVEQIETHHHQYGITGNCFDLALWLLSAFDKAGIKAYPIGNHLKTKQAHVAILAEDQYGRRFLCDLGDQWIQPILIDLTSDAFDNHKLSGFFPGAEVQVRASEEGFEIVYFRPNGKQSSQIYVADPIDREYFWEAAEYSQHHIHPEPLVEVRLWNKDETVHWEFDNWQSFLSTNTGLYPNLPAESIEEWVDRIHKKTHYDKGFLLEALTIYQNLTVSSSE